MPQVRIVPCFRIDPTMGRPAVAGYGPARWNSVGKRAVSNCQGRWRDLTMLRRCRRKRSAGLGLRPETGVEEARPAEKRPAEKQARGESRGSAERDEGEQPSIRGAAQEPILQTGEGDHGTGEHSSGKQYQGESARPTESHAAKPTPAPASHTAKASKT